VQKLARRLGIAIPKMQLSGGVIEPAQHARGAAPVAEGVA
jgi:hypothetical protein